MLTKNEKISILALVILAGFTSGVAYHYILGQYFNLRYPFNTFLFSPGVALSDFNDVVREGSSLNPYFQYKSAQYPFLAVIGYICSKISISKYLYTALIAAGSLLFGVLFLREKSGDWLNNLTNIFIIALLSYPFLITIDRGNFEGLLAIVLLGFSFFFFQKKYTISAVLLAVAIAMKALPIILVVLFVPERKWREIVICLGITFLLTALSLSSFQHGFFPNLDFLLHASNITSNTAFNKFTSISSNWVQRGITLLTLTKIFYYETGIMPQFIYNHFLDIYLALAGFTGSLMILYVIFIEQEIWKRAAILTFAMLLLPTISADYRLLHVFIPLYLFINHERKSKLDWVYIIIFGLLLIPKDYYYFQGVVSDAFKHPHDISISVAINVIMMVSASLIIMISGTKEWLQRKFRMRSQIGMEG